MAARHTAARLTAPPKGLLARLGLGRLNGNVGAPRVRSQIMRDSPGGFLGGWRTSLRERNDEVGSNWHLAASRAIDGLQNSGWLAGAVDQVCADTIGTELRLNATPDSTALGWTTQETRDWCRMVERRWRAWSNDPLECDARGKNTIGDLTDAALRYSIGYGEAVALLPRISRAVSTSALKVMMVPPHRLALETNELDRRFQGVQLDGNGMPVAYRFRRRKQFGAEEMIDVRARGGNGRTQVAHVFDGQPDQIRGLSPLTPVLLRLRQYDTLADATLTASLIQTIVAATIKSPALEGEAFSGFAPSDAEAGQLLQVPDQVAGWLEAKNNYWQASKGIDMGAPSRLAHLLPGEEFQIHKPGTPTDTYLPYSKSLLREIARCLGTTYEAMTGDYEGATYSSVRMATAGMWFVTLRRRKRIAVPFVAPIYANWLEEEITTGRMPFKGGIENFLANRRAATAAEWHGPAKPSADELKSAKASEVRLSTGITSLAYEMAEYGQDPETVFEQRHQETELAKSFGQADPHAPKSSRGDPLGDALATDGGDTAPAKEGTK